MKSTPFNEQTDLAPTPFDAELCQLAKQLKGAGLSWQPHVGCFVWDEAQVIEVSSPFPGRIYFILNLGHFLKRYGTVQDIAAQLVWLPTWHQARLLAQQIGIAPSQVKEALAGHDFGDPGSELSVLYRLILDHLKNRSPKP